MFHRILFLAVPLLIALPTLAHASEETIALTARRSPLIELLLPPPAAPAPVRELEPVEVCPEAPQQPDQSPPAQSWAAAMRAWSHR